jgi:protein-S-isoprenylcysteine O-methyltransferase Ste14
MTALPQAGMLALVVLFAVAAGSHALAVYALGFWHYWLYWLAYRHAGVGLREFRREAVAAKTVALLALGSAYFSFPPDWLSLTVVATGFGLNALAARVLGADRTYYGREVADMPALHVTAFPYSVVAHPMLVGNIAAYGGTLLNPGFREQWWPLALAHVLLNAGLLAMETALAPRGAGAPPAWIHGHPVRSGLAAASAGGALGAVTTGWTDGGAVAAAVIGALSALHALVTWQRYSSSRPASPAGDDMIRGMTQ